MSSRHPNHFNYHFKLSYPLSLGQKIYSFAITPFIFLVILFILIKSFSLFPENPQYSLSFPFLLEALAATFIRLVIAYILALVCAIPLALLTTYNRLSSAILLPIFDIIESVPVLVFFPIIILLFIKVDFFNGAAIFIIFINMLWNIVFNVIGGLSVIPNDFKDAAKVYKFKKFFYLKKIILPAVFPHIITGSLLAWAEGWNMIIVAEVLHTYIPGGTPNDDLFGIGSILVNSSAAGSNAIFIASILIIVSVIALLNFFVWQKLLHYAERYKFE